MPSGTSSADSQFETTQWSVVRAAAGADAAAAREALAELCRQYWYPIYSFIRRRSDVSSAEDLTQSFFAHLLSAPVAASADPAQGKFRAYLLACCNHFLSHERERAAAQKRGGGREPLSLEGFNARDAERRYLREPADDRTPQAHFDRQWALTLLAAALGDLEAECQAAGDGRLFGQLKPMLAGAGEPARYAEIAAELGRSEDAVKQAAHRLRRRYGAILRLRIAQTIERPGQLEDEIRDLFAALRS
jgi:RNA polymerase sigma-70 factor (ECF subfamily)